MSQLKKVVEPFGEVNVYPSSGGKVRVVATILMEPHKEGAQTGIALDGSGSMAKLYGVEEGSSGFLSPLFGSKKKPRNEVTPVAQKICAYLARKIDADGGTTCIYWAVGPGGSQIEEIGDLTADEAERHIFGPPKRFRHRHAALAGRQILRRALPRRSLGVLRLHHRRRAARSGRGEALQRRSWPARSPRAGAIRSSSSSSASVPTSTKTQMEELDDLETGTPIDLWDHKLAAEMRMLQEIFAEVVDKNARIADHGRILDPQGRAIKDYSDTGMSALSGVRDAGSRRLLHAGSQRQ